MEEAHVAETRYRVLEEIGHGAMGKVFLAEDQLLKRKVALKFLVEELAEDEKARKLFLRVARAAAALDHPYVCSVHDTGELEGRTFIAMEYLEGQTLKERMREGPLPIKEALKIASEVAEALEKAHHAGIVHRDLKPANIMLTSEGPSKVMDFGLAGICPRFKPTSSCGRTPIRMSLSCRKPRRNTRSLLRWGSRRNATLQRGGE